nr:RING-H2 finger protein ATL67-like [Ipomoea batatas]
MGKHYVPLLLMQGWQTYGLSHQDFHMALARARLKWWRLGHYSKGIQLAKEMGYRRVCFECDAKKIVEAVTRKEDIGNVADNILKVCRRELEALKLWGIEFTPRELNNATDFVAKASNGRLGFYFLAWPPNKLHQLLEDDKIGLPYWRQTETFSL